MNNISSIDLNLSGTITGNIIPTTTNSSTIGTSTVAFTSSETLTDHTKNLTIWNSTRKFNMSITSQNTSTSSLILPPTTGSTNTFLLNDGTGILSWNSSSRLYYAIQGCLLNSTLVTTNSTIGTVLPIASMT